MIIYKILDGAGGAGRLVLIHLAAVFGHQRVQFGDNPAVQLAPLLVRENLLLVNGPAVEIGVQCEEVVGIIQGAEQLVARFDDTLKVEFQVIPRRCIRHHIPAGGIGSMSCKGFKRIHHVAFRLGHFVALLVEYQSVRHHIFVGHRIKTHHGNSVQGIEPASGLVNTFRDKIGREIALESVLVLKRIVPLRIGHGP